MAIAFDVPAWQLSLYDTAMSDKRPHNMPDTSETYERGHPGKTPGLGEMGDPDHPKGDHSEAHQDSRSNDLESQELNADDTQQQSDVVDPASDVAHGDRRDPADAQKKEQQ